MVSWEKENGKYNFLLSLPYFSNMLCKFSMKVQDINLQTA